MRLVLPIEVGQLATAELKHEFTRNMGDTRRKIRLSIRARISLRDVKPWEGDGHALQINQLTDSPMRPRY